MQVRGARPRAVPVLTRYHDRLQATADFSRNGLVTSSPGPRHGT